MDNYKIGSFLLRLREEKQMTQEEVGDYVGVSNKAVSKWETGDGLPNYEAMVALSTLYGVSINEILDGKRSKENELRAIAHEKGDGSGAYYALNILSIILFATAILALMISNFAGNAFIGGIISLITFVIGGICYGCSFIFGKKNTALIVANNIVGALSFGQATIGAATLGYMASFNALTIKIWYWLLMTFALTVPLAIALGIYSKKALDDGLSFKGAMIKYAHKIISFWLFGLAAFFIVTSIYYVATTNEYGYIFLPCTFLAIGVTCGILSLKYRLAGVIGSYMVFGISIWYFFGYSGRLVINFPTEVYPYEVFVYNLDSILIIITSLIAATLSTIFYVEFRKNLK